MEMPQRTLERWMISSRLSTASSPRRKLLSWTAAVVGMTVMLGGCGGSDEPQPDVPQQPVAVESAPSEPDQPRAPAGSDPPGGMELPDDVVAPANEPDQQQPARGFEMPEEDTTSKLPPGVRQEEESREVASTAIPEVQFASWDEIQSLATSPGKVTVLDLWSLSCEPC